MEKTAPDTLTFRIAGKGIGIPAADLPRLFQPFQRAGNVGQISGTGLGLMIAKRCAELHGGTLEVTSTVGERHHRHCHPESAAPASE